MGLGIFALLVAVFGTPTYCAFDGYTSNCKKEKIAAQTKFFLSEKTWDDYHEMMAEEARLIKKYGQRKFDKC